MYVLVLIDTQNVVWKAEKYARGYIPSNKRNVRNTNYYHKFFHREKYKK